jgi:hypothetical protein
MAQAKSTYYFPPLIFSFALFTSAGLLFWIQPLIAKTLLPLLGGAPAVWNTCLLFFQTMLLLGYLYALASSRWLTLRKQAALHVVLILLTSIYLFRSTIHGVHTPIIPAQNANPTRWLLESLLFSLGPPLFVISASNPLLQSWFSKLRHHLAIDPYFLFAAGNAGSLIALMGFPLVLEPSLGLNEQYHLWRVGFVVLAYYIGYTDRTLHVVRNFFGTTRVTTDSSGRINSLYSGNTVHGRQFVDPSRRCEPLSYHHENGPLGQVMAVFNAAPVKSHVAVIGLGAGAMAAYSKPAQDWTFYEINPDVINIARNSQYFTYLQDCAQGSINIVEGDARLNLQNAQEGQFGLIVLDAFSSDAIPIHLVTQQAIDL